MFDRDTGWLCDKDMEFKGSEIDVDSLGINVGMDDCAAILFELVMGLVAAVMALLAAVMELSTADVVTILGVNLGNELFVANTLGGALMIIGGGELVKSSPILDEEIILVGVEPPIPNVPMVRVAWPEDSGEIILDAAELDTSEATGLGIKLVSPALSELETLKGLIGDTVKPAGVGEVSDPVGLVGEEVDGVDLLVETVGQDTPDSLRDRLNSKVFTDSRCGDGFEPGSSILF